MQAEQEEVIPRQIFSFWSGKRSTIVDACHRRFHELHPTWQVRIYSDFAEVEPCEGFDNLALQHKTDWLRICLLAEHGGVWLDASMILNKPITAWLDMSEHRVVGFQCPIGMHESSPVLENWTLAAKPRHPMLIEWKAELKRAISMGYDAYKALTLQRMPSHPIHKQLPYLTMHAAYVKIHDPTQVHMIDCFDPRHGPFRFTQQEWRSGNRVWAVFKMFREPWSDMSVIKLTGEGRIYADVYLALFPVAKDSYMHRTLKLENPSWTPKLAIAVLICLTVAWSVYKVIQKLQRSARPTHARSHHA